MIGPSTILSVVQGATLTRTLQGFNEDGTIPTQFLGTDTLTGTVFLAQAEPPIVSLTPVWFLATSCQVTVTLTSAQTSTLSIDTLYNLQVFATRGGITYCVAWLYLQILPAAGSQTSAAPPDLVTGPYAAQLLASLVLTPAQLEMIPTLITASSNAIRSYCNRRFDQGVYVEDCPVELDGTIRLKNPPINQILRTQAQPTMALTVTNPSTSVQIARCYLTVTGDAVAGQTITGLTLVSVASGVQTTTPIVYSAGQTIASLATAINSVGGGWLAMADSVLGQWPVTEMIEGLIAQGGSQSDNGALFAVYAQDLSNVRFHPDDGQLTGIVWCGQQYSGLGPRWGPGWAVFDSGGSSTMGRVKVTYNGAFAVVPPQIQLGCVELAKMQLLRLRTDLLLVSETAGQYSYTINPRLLLALPPEVLGGIAAYRITNA